jgi:hypothetical protein
MVLALATPSPTRMPTTTDNDSSKNRIRMLEPSLQAFPGARSTTIFGGAEPYSRPGARVNHPTQLFGFVLADVGMDEVGSASGVLLAGTRELSHRE